MKKNNRFFTGLSVGCLVVLLFGMPPNSAAQKKNKVKDNIQTLMILKMTQALDLSEEQAAKIFPKMNRIEKEKSAIHREIGRQIMELRLILDREQPDEQKMVEKMQEIKQMRLQLRAIDEDFEAFLDENLTLEQRAKYVVFSQEFFKLLRDKLDRARRYQERLKKIR
jgi:Spy/CpxP family protein refolding chaperone